MDDHTDDFTQVLKDHIINLKCRTNEEMKKRYRFDWFEYELKDILQIKLP